MDVSARAPAVQRKRYPIRDHRGSIVAYHDRIEDGEGKRFEWRQPDETLGLGGFRTEDLPLFGSPAAHSWDADNPVIVCEGEKAALGLVRAGRQAAGTVTGAAGCPSREPLMVLLGMPVLLWPDNDQAGGMHMLKVARALGEPGEIAASVGWIVWPDAPPHGDAADALAAGVDIAALIAAAGPVIGDPPEDEIATVEQPRRRTPRATLPRYAEAADSPIARFNAAVTVSDVLLREWRIEARPGRTIRCPAHEDRHPSLSVLPDNRRVVCHAPGCSLNDNGRGADAWALCLVARGSPR